MKYKRKPQEIEAIAFIPMHQSKLEKVGVVIRSDASHEGMNSQAFWKGEVFEVYNELHDSWIKIKLNDFVSVNDPKDHYPIDRDYFIKNFVVVEPDKWKQYIGVKVITAIPMRQGTFLSQIKGEKNVGDKAFEVEGYMVKYADGYESWSPKDVFEEAYREVSPKERAMFGWTMEYNKEIGGV